MENFAKKYGPMFAKLCAFMQKHLGANSDKHWQAVASEIGQFNESFESRLIVLIVKELVIMSNNGIIEPTRYYQANYRPVFERTYRLLQKHYPVTNGFSWDALMNEIAAAQYKSDFEGKLAEAVRDEILDVRREHAQRATA